MLHVIVDILYREFFVVHTIQQELKVNVLHECEISVQHVVHYFFSTKRPLDDIIINFVLNMFEHCSLSELHTDTKTLKKTQINEYCLVFTSLYLLQLSIFYEKTFRTHIKGIFLNLASK
jgi:hypothetical protein